jgi:hypothetical protein
LAGTLGRQDPVPAASARVVGWSPDHPRLRLIIELENCRLDLSGNQVLLGQRHGQNDAAIEFKPKAVDTFIGARHAMSDLVNECVAIPGLTGLKVPTIVLDCREGVCRHGTEDTSRRRAQHGWVGRSRDGRLEHELEVVLDEDDGTKAAVSQ